MLERSHRLLAILMLLQIIQILQEIWWRETYSLVYATMAFTAVVELLFTHKRALRLVLSAIAVIVLSVQYSPFFEWTGWPAHWKDGQEWLAFLDAHVATLHPFAEIGFGMVLAVHVLCWLGRSRGGLLSAMFGAIGLMAVIDSFFPYELWRNIAWVVVAGLGWLVILHLRQLRDRHPDSWEALAERPIELALPAVIVISALLVFGILMPRAPALLEDPYTIWTQAQGREVPSLSGEGGILNGSSGSQGASGSSSSGYSRDDSQIGGGFEYDYSPVMTVTTTRRSYWRGEAKTVYTGKGWEDVQPQLTLQQVGAGTGFAAERGENVATEKLVQTVQILSEERLPVLFGASPISQVVSIEGDGVLVGNREEQELRFRRPSRVQTYTVESLVTVLDRAALRNVVNPAPDAAAIDLAPYLQLPDTVPGRVADLAAEVTASATNMYDKADLLAQYLQFNYNYNNKPDVSKQKSEDVVDAFLFEIREGYCDYFSTAFVVMARTLGIPARWVKGYTSGVDLSKVESLGFSQSYVDLDGPGTYTVRNADAHSWAEVYFEGYGWIPFEPTSGFAIPMPEPIEAEPALEYDPVVSEPAETASVKSTGMVWVYVAAGLAVLFAVTVAVWVMRHRAFALRMLHKIRYAGASPNQRIVREMEKFLKYMKKRGLKRETHETLREAFQRWGDKFAPLRPELESVLLQFEQARYSQVPGAETDARQFELAVARLRKSI